MQEEGGKWKQWGLTVDFFLLGVTAEQFQCHCRCGQTDPCLALQDFNVAVCNRGLCPTLGSILEPWPSGTNPWCAVKQLRCGPTIGPQILPCVAVLDWQQWSLWLTPEQSLTRCCPELPRCPAWKSRKAQTLCTCVSVPSVPCGFSQLGGACAALLVCLLPAITAWGSPNPGGHFRHQLDRERSFLRMW